MTGHWWGKGFHAKGGTGETCQGLFSHADQQRAAETLTCQYSTAEFKGAGGRIADAVAKGWALGLVRTCWMSDRAGCL